MYGCHLSASNRQTQRSAFSAIAELLFILLASAVAYIMHIIDLQCSGFPQKFHLHKIIFIAIMACVSWPLQLRNVRFCWSKVLLPACPCWWQLLHLRRHYSYPRWWYLHCLCTFFVFMKIVHNCDILTTDIYVHIPVLLLPFLLPLLWPVFVSSFLTGS